MAAGAVLAVALTATLYVLARPSGTRLTAYFGQAVGVYTGSDLRVLGVRIGKVESVRPEGRQVRVTMSIDHGVDVPADAVAVVVAPSVVALTLYSLLPIVRNTIVGLAGVDRTLVDAARGIGMTRTAILLRIELPLAWPVILTGVRVSTQLAMGIAAIAAYVSGPGLGEQIFSGLARLGGANAINMPLAGTVLIIILALLFDGCFVLIGRLTTPRGVRV